MVVSIDGYHEGTAVEDVGLTRLSKIVREEKWMPRSYEELVAEFQVSERYSKDRSRSVKIDSGMVRSSLCQVLNSEFVFTSIYRKLDEDFSSLFPRTQSNPNHRTTETQEHWAVASYENLISQSEDC